MRLVGVVSALALLSALAGLIGGVRVGNYFLVGLEVVVLTTGAMGILVGLGRFNFGPAIAAACVGGGVATPSVLSYISQAPIGPLLGASPRLLLAIRLLMGLLIFAAAAWVLLARCPERSLSLLVRGALAGAPVAIFASLYALLPGLRDAIAGLHIIAEGLLWSLLGLLGLVLISISGHCLIRAFEVGVEAGERAVEASEKNSPAGA